MLKSLLPSWLRGPLKIEVDFDDHPYRLEETINLTVELSSRKDVEVSDGRVDLVCEEKWGETWVKQEKMGRAAGMLGRGPEIPGPPAPKREVKEFKESFVHSTAVFAKGTRVRPDAPVRHSVRLDIDVERPPHAQGVTLSWTLVTTVATIGGHKVTGTREVTVAIR